MTATAEATFWQRLLRRRRFRALLALLCLASVSVVSAFLLTPSRLTPPIPGDESLGQVATRTIKANRDLDVLDAEGAPARWVMHCFSGNPRFARECLDRGAHLSFAGTVTFKNAQPLRDALAITPLDRILVETDAPFLTPTPYRGRPNASYLVPVTVRAIRIVPITASEPVLQNAARSAPVTSQNSSATSPDSTCCGPIS